MHLLKSAFTAISVCAGAAHADTHQHDHGGDAYLCNAALLTGKGWIPGEFVIEFLPQRGVAQVSDAAFSSTVPARVVPRSEVSLEVSWIATHEPPGGGQGKARPRFRALVNMVNLKMTVRSERTFDAAQVARGAGFCALMPPERKLARREIN